MNHPLKNRDFRWLLISRLFGNLGLGFAEVPLMWWVLETTGQASLVATVALIGAIGALIASPLGGVFADRGNKKLQIQLTLIADALVQGILIWALVSGSLTLWGVYVLVGLSALFGNLRSPALSALMPQILGKDQYQEGNASMSLVTTVGMAASFALAGVATGSLGVAAALWIGLGLIVLSSLSLLPLTEREPVRSSNSSVEADGAMAGGLLEGLRFIYQTPVLFWLIALAMLLNLILAPFGALMAPYSKLLGGSATQYGLLSAGMLVGQLLGYVLLNFIKSKNGPITFLLGTLGMAVAVGLLAVAPSFWIALGLLGLMGFASAWLNVQAMTLVQKAVPPDKMGRVFGVLMGLNMGVQPLGLAATSGLLAWWGVRPIFALMSGLLVLASLAFLQPKVRTSLVYEDEGPLEPVGVAPGGSQ